MKKTYLFPANALYRRYMKLAAILMMAVAAGGALFELIYFISFSPSHAILSFFRYSFVAGAGVFLMLWEKKHRTDENPEWVLLPSYIFSGAVFLGNVLTASWDDMVWLFFGVGAVVALYILTVKGVLKVKLPLFISSLAVPAFILTLVQIELLRALSNFRVINIVGISYSVTHHVLMGLFLALAVLSLKANSGETVSQAPVGESADETQEPVAAQRFCASCGASLSEDTAFCTQCGRRVH